MLTGTTKTKMASRQSVVSVEALEINAGVIALAILIIGVLLLITAGGPPI